MRTLRCLMVLLALASPLAAQDTIRISEPVTMTVIPVAPVVTIPGPSADTTFLCQTIREQRERSWFSWSDYEVVEVTEWAPCAGAVDPGEPTNPPPDPDPQPDPDPVDPDPIDPGDAWYVQTWDFSNTSQMLAAPDIGNATAGGGRVSLLTNAGGPGFNRAVRATFDANAGGEPQVGVDIYFPNASRDRPREIWFEYYARFSSNWEVNGPYGGSAGHKHLFLFDQEETGAGRWEHFTGLFGELMSMEIAGRIGPGGQQAPFRPNFRALWDGDWHRFRCHARMDSRNGVWECDVDGQLFRWGTGNTSRGSGYYFNQMALSRNLNKGTNRTMTLDFGPVTVYTSDPGWQ